MDFVKQKFFEIFMVFSSFSYMKSVQLLRLYHRRAFSRYFKKYLALFLMQYRTLLSNNKSHWITYCLSVNVQHLMVVLPYQIASLTIQKAKKSDYRMKKSWTIQAKRSDHIMKKKSKFTCLYYSFTLTYRCWFLYNT
jgi:hypothetical protein